ncbi:hypothetical protein [Novosphingopyxis iocasae]|uniref:hypothetical protein n=1 Tax=Novosphingopyxis iocasae TaxID=2762729 RepID=UPI001650F7DA|nr:hypothetical protein [Novosphingopyxis iocasae]|tara:strand:- start:116 stop:307 length:192 start_codon:yes stop_codon:yes gene_type:complete
MNAHSKDFPHGEAASEADALLRRIGEALREAVPEQEAEMPEPLDVDVEAAMKAIAKAMQRGRR